MSRKGFESLTETKKDCNINYEDLLKIESIETL